jgi:uncharacterized protein (TIGR04551 family)
VKRLVLALVMLAASAAGARVGFGDPSSDWRDRKPEQVLMFDGHLRLRGAVFSNLDLGRPAGPTTSVWPEGEGPLNLTGGGDMRLRLAPSVFLGDTVRLGIELDLANAGLGSRPTGTPFGESTALVAATAFQEPLEGIRLRSAYGQVLLPFGVLAAGRMPSHFGLGIASNAGDDLDDDGGDRADRIALMMPLFGHYVAAGFDVAATGPLSPGLGIAPDAGRLSNGMYAASLALVRYHAPWEADLYREAGRVHVNYGVAVSASWQDQDVPGFYQSLDPAFANDPAAQVRRGASAALVDVWARLTFGALRVELEGVASSFTIDNPSPWAGVEVRQPVTGNPAGAVLQIAHEPPDGALELMLEGGVASADPAAGFPLSAPTSFAGGRPGDVFGSQLDGKRDARMDAYRFHPAYRVDLILWRTLLGGVSEAGYGRGRAKWRALEDLSLEANLVYSHGLSAASTPGGVAPLGAELDLAAVGRFDHFSLRLDWGGLVPLGGLGSRGGSAPPFAQMLLVRLGYES